MIAAPRRFVLFLVRGRRFALPLAEVREVVPVPTQLTRVPRAPSAIAGVFNLRGRVATVVDTAALLELSGEPPPTAVPRLVVLEGNPRDLALRVDELVGIRESEIEPPPPGATADVVGLLVFGTEGVTVLEAARLAGRVRALLP